MAIDEESGNLRRARRLTAILLTRFALSGRRSFRHVREQAHHVPDQCVIREDETKANQSKSEDGEPPRTHSSLHATVILTLV